MTVLLKWPLRGLANFADESDCLTGSGTLVCASLAEFADEFKFLMLDRSPEPRQELFHG